MNQSRPVVLFLCVHNAGRSQMAAALVARHAGDKLVIHSAGSDPRETLNPAVVVAMAELGIDISDERPKKLTDEMAHEANVIVTMGCGDACPVYRGKRYVDWELPDPAGKSIEEVRQIRDDIDTKVKALVAELLRVHVRRVDSTEWPTVRAVRLRALQDSPDAFSSSYEEEVHRPDDWWAEAMTRLVWFVAQEEEAVVGVVAGMPLGDHPEVISLWVDPRHRGVGVSDALLAAVRAWAEAHGAVGLCLAVAENNHVARLFYERAGFVASAPGKDLRNRPEVCTTEMRLHFGGG